MIKKNHVEIFTDGACQGNPGPGGWGALLRYGETVKSLSAAEAHTTNNRMELMAAIMGLSALQRHCQVLIVTDSNYVKKGITEWLPKWRLKGWKTADNKPIKNQDLWERLSELVAKHEVKWEWVKGHSGHVENEMADQLARDAIQKLKDH